MKFEKNRAKRLIRALSTTIDFVELTQAEMDVMYDKLYRRSYDIYLEPEARRGRTLQDIMEQGYVGEIGEVLIAKWLDVQGFEVERNDEKVTGEYHWDLRVDGLKIELKYQGHEKEFISFDHSKMVQHAVDHYRDYDFMVCWKKTKTDGVRPWYLVDPEVFNPEHRLYGPSQYKGTYIQVGNAARYLRLLTKPQIMQPICDPV